MNEFIKKEMKNWRTVLSNPRYYYEVLKEEIGRFKYPPRGIEKHTINIFKLNRINKKLEHSNKLHIGCGDVRINGFINIDTFRTSATDFNCEIEDLPKYIKPNSIKLIYSCHVLEHFNRSDSIQILKMFYDFLEPEGELRISVPDLIKLADIAKTKNLEFKDMELIQGILMGGQGTRYNYHKSIYWFELLKQVLYEIGFSKICEYPSYPHFMGDIKDASLAGKPNFGTYISLNVKAIK